MNWMLFKHIYDWYSVTCFFDKNRAKVVKWFWCFKVKTILNFFKKVSKVKVVYICIEIEPLEVLRLECLRWLEVTFTMNGIIQDYFKVSLDSLHEVRNIDTVDISFFNCNSKPFLANSIYSTPDLSCILRITKNNVQEIYNSSFFIIFLSFSWFVPLALYHDTILNISSEKILDSTSDNFSLNDFFEPV
jgi:hypothetical protein